MPPPPTEQTDVGYPSLKARANNKQLVCAALSDDEMSWKTDTPPSSRYGNCADEKVVHPTPAEKASAVDNCTETPLSAKWQREREAVSRQVQKANSSQVIVIDSDSEKEHL